MELYISTFIHKNIYRIYINIQFTNIHLYIFCVEMLLRFILCN